MIRRIFGGAVLLVVAVGCSMCFAKPSARPDKLRPAPTLEAKALPNGHIALLWRSSGDSLCLERRLPQQELFSVEQCFAPSQCAFEDSSLAPGATAVFRLRPVHARYLEEYGREVTIQSVLTSPPRLRLSRIAADSVQVELNNSETASSPIVVERKINGVFASIGRIMPGQLSLSDGPLAGGDYLHYRLRFERDESAVSPSPEDSILLDLASPSNFTLSYLNDHTVRLDWQPVDRFSSRMEIEKQTPTGAQRFIMPTGATGWIDSSLAYATRTNYRLRSVTAVDSGDFSSAVSAYYRVSPVERLELDPVHDRVAHLSWQANDSLTDHFIVERAGDSIRFTPLALLSGKVFGYADSLRERGQTHYYRITSVTSGGDTAVSAIIWERIAKLDDGMVLVHGSEKLRDFYCDAFETTVADYLAFCRSTGRTLPANPGFPGYPDFWNKAFRMPAVNVSWNDAAAFCNWRSQAVGLPAAYDSSGDLIAGSRGYHLLDRIHFITAQQTVSDTTEPVIGASGNPAEPMPSDSLIVLPKKIHHLLGNVWEWTDEVTADGCHVILGGAYSTPKNLFTALPEFCYRADYSSPTIGFRCMLELEE